MRLHRMLILSVLMLALSANVAAPALTQPGLLADLSPQIVLRALDLGDAIRYTASLIKPADLDLQTASFTVTLPPDAVVETVFETDRVTFSGVRRDPGATTLVWQGANLSAADAIDALAFTLAQELTADMQVYVEYVSATMGAVALSGKPEVVLALAEEEGELVVGPEGTGARMLPVGPSGVRIGMAPGLLTEPITITARQLPGSQNPPPELTGDEGALFWWCSVVQVDALPEGAAVTVMVPARRPIAPFTPVQLFKMQSDGSWQPLEALGIVSGDGQYIQYVHPGGVIAAGVEEAYRPRPVETIVEIRPVIAYAPGSVGSSRPQPVDGTTPRGLPVCAQTIDATVPCQADDGSVRVCQPGLLNCTFTYPNGGTCFRPSAPAEPICEVNVLTGAAALITEARSAG
ncbi:MAG: hypothetical protein NZM00_06865 [Anaerolinea sp.]|nr:hypothetical protein [Anaerolinea sp.]